MVNFRQPTTPHRLEKGEEEESSAQIMMKELPPRVVRRFAQRLATNDTSLKSLLSDQVMFVNDGNVTHGPNQVASKIFEAHRRKPVWDDWERNSGNRWSRYGHVRNYKKRSHDHHRVQQSLKLSHKKDDDNEEHAILTIELVTVSDENSTNYLAETRSLAFRYFFSSPRRGFCGGADEENDDGLVEVETSNTIVSPHIFFSKAAGSLC